MKTLPEHVKHYKSTPEFTEDTAPPALQRDHSTVENVWARIVVNEGALRYCIEEPEREQHLLSPGTAGIIEPRMKHHVELTGPVRFCVEFYR
ncbi:MAG: DUF1971 domain-containing protein [Telluria sp.]